MSRNIPLEAGRGVELTPEFISGGGDRLFCRLCEATRGANARSFLGEGDAIDIDEWILGFIGRKITRKSRLSADKMDRV